MPNCSGKQNAVGRAAGQAGDGTKNAVGRAGRWFANVSAVHAAGVEGGTDVLPIARNPFVGVAANGRIGHRVVVVLSSVGPVAGRLVTSARAPRVVRTQAGGTNVGFTPARAVRAIAQRTLPGRPRCR